jgi:hypothetical protein
MLILNSHPVMLTLRSVAMALNLLNVAVLANRRLHTSIFKGLCLTAVADCLYLLSMNIISVMIVACDLSMPQSAADRCGGPSISIYFYVLFMFLDEYLTSCLALFGILMEIYLTIQRILVITNSRSCLARCPIRYMCSSIAALSFLIYSPYLAMYEVQGHYIRSSEFGQSNAAVTIRTVIGLLRIFLVLFVLFVLNIVTIFKLKAYLLAKSRLSTDCKYYFQVKHFE